MQHLGFTRSAYRRDHYLQTRDTFIRAALPGMHRALAVVHAAPASGAGFTQYTAEMEPEGTLAPVALQRFLYVLSGSVAIGNDELTAGGYAYLPPAAPSSVRAIESAQLAVIEKSHVSLGLATSPAPFFAGRENDIAPQNLLGDPDLQVRALLPDSPAFDFAVNTLAYQPGASLPLVEVHVMEHGLLMLEGGGIYRLGDSWYPVTAGDFIYMAPFCPQWYGALGKTPSRYLIYKNWNRHPDAAASAAATPGQ